MNKIYNFLLLLTAYLFISCSDFLDVLPLNDVVLENYWTKKSDVTSVLMGCYESLQSEDCVTRMGLWGEVRSDNMKIGVASSQDLEQLVKENILPSNSFCNWAVFYQTINRCNILIHYAPQVQEQDPNYALSEMKANIAPRFPAGMVTCTRSIGLKPKRPVFMVMQVPKNEFLLSLLLTMAE